MLKHSLNRAIEKKQESIKALLSKVQEESDKLAKDKNKNWGNLGSLGKIEQDLKWMLHIEE